MIGVDRTNMKKKAYSSSSHLVDRFTHGRHFNFFFLFIYLFIYICLPVILRRRCSFCCCSEEVYKLYVWHLIVPKYFTAKTSRGLDVSFTWHLNGSTLCKTTKKKSIINLVTMCCFLQKWKPMTVENICGRKMNSSKNSTSLTLHCISTWRK